MKSRRLPTRIIEQVAGNRAVRYAAFNLFGFAHDRL